MAIWTGDLTEEQKIELDYLVNKIKNCKKLQEHAESSAEMERLDNEIYDLERRIGTALNARIIYEELLKKAKEAVDEVETWAKKWGIKK